jgi:hypothetical protein
VAVLAVGGTEYMAGVTQVLDASAQEQLRAESQVCPIETAIRGRWR